MKEKRSILAWLTPLGWCAFFSVLAHLVVLGRQVRLRTDIAPLADREVKPIEITELPPEVVQEMIRKKRQKLAKRKELEVAETEDAKNRDLDPDAKFLSDKTQTAEQESRAKNVDDFRKQEGTGAKGREEGQTPPTSVEGDAPPNSAEDGIGAQPRGQALGVKRDWKTLSIKDLGVAGDGGAAGATDDRLSEIVYGERTVLSTREFRFFSYYHRIKELLRQYWKPNVERQLARLWSKGKNVGEEELVTQVLVLLDTKGVIQRVSRIGSSGIVELDDAAVEAFQRAAPFPNPPKGMQDNDGFVRIRWDFILKTETGPRIQFRSAGSPPTH